jgi:hypothetical protein
MYSLYFSVSFCSIAFLLEVSVLESNFKKQFCLKTRTLEGFVPLNLKLHSYLHKI